MTALSHRRPSPSSTRRPLDPLRHNLRRPTLPHLRFLRPSPRPLRHADPLQPPLAVPIPRYLYISTRSTSSAKPSPRAPPYTSATSPSSTLPSPPTPAETSVALSAPTPTSSLPPTPAETAVDAYHLRDRALSFTSTDWADEQRGEMVCAAAAFFKSLGLHPHPMPQYKDTTLPAFVLCIFPHRDFCRTQ